MQLALVYLLYTQECVSVIPKLLVFPRPRLETTSLLPVSVSLFLFYKQGDFLDATYKLYYRRFVFV